MATTQTHYPIRGHVYAATYPQGQVPVLVLSDDRWNRYKIEVMVARIVSAPKCPPAAVTLGDIADPIGGHVLCDDLEAVHVDQLSPQSLGPISPSSLRLVEITLKSALGLV